MKHEAPVETAPVSAEREPVSSPSDAMPASVEGSGRNSEATLEHIQALFQSCGLSDDDAASLVMAARATLAGASSLAFVHDPSTRGLHSITVQDQGEVARRLLVKYLTGQTDVIGPDVPLQGLEPIGLMSARRLIHLAASLAYIPEIRKLSS